MRFYGTIGFWIDETEIKPGIWGPQIIERKYKGDIISDNRRFVSNESQKDDFTISNTISILADLYAQKNWPSIKYVIWNGTKFKVDKIDVSYPRIQLSLGGIYNGQN